MGLSWRKRSLLSDLDLLPLLCLHLCSLLLLSSSRLLFLFSSSELGSSLGPSSGSPAPSLLCLLSSSLLSSLLLRWLPWLLRLSLLGLRSGRCRSSLEPDLLGVLLRSSREPDLLGVLRRCSREPDLLGVLCRVDRGEVARLALLFLPSLAWDRRECSNDPGQLRFVGPRFVGFPLCSDLGVLHGSLPQSV